MQASTVITQTGFVQGHVHEISKANRAILFDFCTDPVLQ